MATFILTDDFKKILEKQEIIDALASKGYRTKDSFVKEILKRINQFDVSLNLKSISYHMLQDTDTYIGIILDEYLNKLYNVCIIPPILGTRSGFLSQQIFGFVSNLINGQKTNKPYSLCDKPVIIINCMVESLANSAICNIIGSKIAGFNYIDIFNRNEDFGSSNLNLIDFVNTVSQYKDISKDIELTKDTLILKTQRLKDFSTSLTNEPYYFAVTAYPAVILAQKEGYQIDITDFEKKLAHGKPNKNVNAFVSFVKKLKAMCPFQQIFYGAPGTGKSHRIKKQLKALNVPKENIFRTTFHPDSDYSTFVGVYKPTMKPVADKYKAVAGKDEEITYSFVPQAFIKAYARAYQTTENVYLVIEEINRGNCAQIFGDLFQLLDRDENGVSEYTIKADADLKAFLENGLGKDANGIKDGELCLPSNLYIWATMNTSDQSLFPIDSAFKRRWDWEYEPIKYKNVDWVVKIGNTEYSWVSFQKEVNNRIFDATNSEDKMLGDFFVKPHDGIISEKLLLNKVLFYLWNDVCKDGDGDIFRTDDNKEVKFSDLYGEKGTNILLSMMEHLGVTPLRGNTEKDDENDENNEKENEK